MTTRLCLLGGLSVCQGEARQQIPLDRPSSVLIYLAVRADWVSRAELALIYRPDSHLEQGLAYLRTVIHRARRLDWAGGMEVQSDRVRFGPSTDIADFRTAVSQQRWADALSLYQGPFLRGMSLPRVPGFESWVDIESEALQAAWAHASRACAAELSAHGRHEQAAAIHRRLLEADPLDEDSLQAYLRALSADGRTSEAIRAFERFSQELEEEVGGQPLESTLLLADSLHKRNRTSAGTSRGHLPHAPTSFIGRAEELELIDRLLAERSARLIVIQGLGGTGKTRLATEAVRNHGDRTKVRTAFASLAALTVPERLPLAIAEALDLKVTGDDAQELLEEALRSQDLLLLLDNFEGMLAAAPYLTRLLEAAPGLSIVVTSRESLRLNGEYTVELTGLKLASEDASHRDDAAALFIERAARHSPGFTASGTTLEAVFDICRQVECLPLAIEIAATWTRLMPVTELSSQLATRSALLTSDLLDLPERQRSVWSIFDHVWESLSQTQQEVMVRLSTFRDGFTLEAATGVAGADLEGIASLLDRSLVRRTEQHRFTMHELLRQHIEMQVPQAELLKARSAHTRWFSRQAAQIVTDLRGSDLPAGLAKVEADRANFETAWNHAIEVRDLHALEECREMLDYYFYYRARFRAASSYFSRAEQALTQITAHPGPEQRAAGRLQGRLLAQQAEKEFHLEGTEKALATAAHAVSLLERWGSPVDRAHGRLVLGSGYLYASDFMAARQEFQHVLQIARDEEDAYLEAAARNGLAMLLTYADGDVRGAEQQYRISLRLHQSISNLEGVTGALTNLGACRFDLDDLDEAEQLWTQAAEMCAEVGYQHREAALLNNLGAVAESHGDFKKAAEVYQRSLSMRRELHNRPGTALVLASLGRLGLQRQDPKDARRWLQEALDIQLELKDFAGVAHSRSHLARALLQLGRQGEAADQALKALSLSVGLGSRLELLSSLLSGALLLAELGEHGRAAGLAAGIAAHAAGSQEPVRTSALELLEQLTDALPEQVPDDLNELADVTGSWLQSGAFSKA